MNWKYQVPAKVVQVIQIIKFPAHEDHSIDIAGEKKRDKSC